MSWKEIEGFNEYYVNEKGQILSLKGKTPRILKQNIVANGYLGVSLCKDGKTYSKRVHILVAKAFLENSENLEQVNHKDEDKTNNSVDNLEWCTAKYNANYGHRNDKISESLTGIERPYQYRAIIQRDKEGHLLMIYRSIKEATEAGYTEAGISNCCRNRLKTHRGYIWEYVA